MGIVFPFPQHSFNSSMCSQIQPNAGETVRNLMSCVRTGLKCQSKKKKKRLQRQLSALKRESAITGKQSTQLTGAHLCQYQYKRNRASTEGQDKFHRRRGQLQIWVIKLFLSPDYGRDNLIPGLLCSSHFLITVGFILTSEVRL